MTDATQHHRRSIRLSEYDYADEGAYFVTLCTHERACLFGYVDGDAMTLNPYGRIVWNEWENTATLRENIELDEFVVMPNHVHGIIWIVEPENRGDNFGDDSSNRVTNVGARCIAPVHPNIPRKFGPLAAKSLSTIVGTFKAAVTRRINLYRNAPGGIVWQRNYWERVIRDEDELNWLRFYIHTNPARWHSDKLYVSKSDIMR